METQEINTDSSQSSMSRTKRSIDETRAFDTKDPTPTRRANAKSGTNKET